MSIMCKLRNFIRLPLLRARYFFLYRVYQMNIAPDARISWGARLDKTNPSGIHIGNESYIASGAIIFSHDYARGIHLDTYIGKRCFIGANAIISCGVTVGDEVIIGAGAVVTKDIPSNCVAAGSPARIIRRNIRTRRFGQLIPDEAGPEENQPSRQ